MKTAKKSVSMVFRVERKLRADFLSTVEAKGENASEVLRRAMRDYLTRYNADLRLKAIRPLPQLS